MTSVSITQHKDGRAFVEVDGKQLERVLSVSLSISGGGNDRRPYCTIRQMDENLKPTLVRFVPTTFTMDTNGS